MREHGDAARRSRCARSARRAPGRARPGPGRRGSRTRPPRRRAGRAGAPRRPAPGRASRGRRRRTRPGRPRGARLAQHLLLGVELGARRRAASTTVAPARQPARHRQPDLAAPAEHQHRLPHAAAAWHSPSDDSAARRVAILGACAPPCSGPRSPTRCPRCCTGRRTRRSGWTAGTTTRTSATRPGWPGFVAGLGPEWAGLSLTMPLKRVALEVADGGLPAGRGHRRGQHPGAHRRPALRRQHRRRRHRRGPARGRVRRAAGGRSCSARAAPRRPRWPRCASSASATSTVLVRSPGRAGELRAAAERLGVDPGGQRRPPRPGAGLGRPGRRRRGGLHAARGGRRPAAPASGPETVLLDVVYAPWPTPFAAAAAAAGARVVSGLEMLLHQAVAQVELMTGRPGPVGDRCAPPSTPRSPAARG